MFGNARRLLAACLEERYLHGKYQKPFMTSADFLPTRVVDLQTITAPQLVLSENVQIRDWRYVCLSQNLNRRW
jgi:hypothetical protein